jgi:hypothetical protein
MGAQAAAPRIALTGLADAANANVEVLGNGVGARVGLNGWEGRDRPLGPAPADDAVALGLADAGHERRIFVLADWQQEQEAREVERDDNLNRLRHGAVARQWGGVRQDADMMEIQPVVPYARLTPLLVTQEEISGVECGILYASFAEIEQPVAVKTGAIIHIFEYAALLRHWQDHGTNPSTTRELSLQDILRVVVQQA